MVSESSNGIEGLSMIRWNFVKAYPIFHCNKMVFLVLPYPVDTYLATILLFTHQIILPFLSRKEFPLQPNPCLLGTTLADLNKTSFFFLGGRHTLYLAAPFHFNVNLFDSWQVSFLRDLCRQSIGSRIRLGHASCLNATRRRIASLSLGNLYVISKSRLFSVWCTFQLKRNVMERSVRRISGCLDLIHSPYDGYCESTWFFFPIHLTEDQNGHGLISQCQRQPLGMPHGLF